VFVREIHIKKFRHLEDIHLGPFTAPGEISTSIALAGPNGGGKSSILEVLGFALSNSLSLSWVLHRTFPDHAFEVCFGLNDLDVTIIDSWLADATPSDADRAAADELKSARVVYRGFNMHDGVSVEDATRQNRMFRVATQALKDHYQRSVGLFLRSDRYYPQKAFDKKKLLQWDNLKKPVHLYSFAFSSSDLQYQDMYDHLVQLRYHYFRELGHYHYAKENGALDPDAELPTDPLEPYDELLGRLFPGYRFAFGATDIPDDLFVSINEDLTLQFRDLSSGEKEVFFILASMLRHNVQNAILVVDEPEMHLHPEFARILVREVVALNGGNQVWLATHNPEIVDEVGRESTILVARDKDTQLATVSWASDEPEASRVLREMFGFSGYIGIGRSLVFLEGIDSSLDRKVWSRLLPAGGSLVKLVPAGGVTELTRINAAVLKIIEDGLGHMQFYAIRDRDYLTDEQIESYNTHPSNRIRVLRRHQIENYLLVPTAIATVLNEIYEQSLSPDQVLSKLHESAESISAEVAAGLVRQQISSIWHPDEILPAAFLRGESVAGDTDTHRAAQETLANSTLKRAEDLVRRLDGALSTRSVEATVSTSISLAQEWLTDDRWMTRYPGKRIIEVFVARLGIGKPGPFQNSLIQTIASNPVHLLDEELTKLFDEISRGVDELSTI